MELEEEDQVTYERHHKLCTSLNMDKAAADDAWKSYLGMKQNYTLEGDQLHWLCCALYVACRRSQTPTLGNPPIFIEGNLVSLTRLLRQCNLSLIQFFKKCKKWADMANLPKEFRSKFDHLERKYEVSKVIFIRYKQMFLDIFNEPTPEIYQHKSKKPRNFPCSSSRLFNFCWTLYITIKGSFTAVAVDLVSSYHLLLACCDLMYSNALLANRKDLLNPKFEGNADAGFTSLLDPLYFESNFKEINKVYDKYTLSVGEFDERIFLSDEANEDIGTLDNMDGDEGKKNSQSESKSLAPPSPLTGKKWLKNDERETSTSQNTALSTATQAINRLKTILEGRQAHPSEKLYEIYATCEENPEEKIDFIVNELGKKFGEAYNQPNDHTPAIIFYDDKLVLAKKLFYKLLENILLYEKKIKPDVNLNVRSQNIVHQCLFACSLEIIIYTYNSQKSFPWILNALNIESYYFYKVIEMVLRTEDQLPRVIVKYLSMVEENILETLVWQNSSPLWIALKNESTTIPKCEDVLLPSQIMDESHSQNNYVLNASEKPKRTGSLSIFFRKFYSLSSVRMQDLCVKLGIKDISLMKKIWTCFEHCIVHHIELMQDRHLDQILMCSIYVICKFEPTERSFMEIMKCYRFQPQAASHVYRSVLLSKTALGKFFKRNNENSNKGNGISSVPLTPNNLAGTSTSYDNQERGDLIKFYNSVYVATVQSFVNRFRSNQQSDVSLQLLSPIPKGRSTSKSPMRRVSQKHPVFIVSQKHSVYVRPLDTSFNLSSGSQALTYCVNRSPAKDLRAINDMINDSGIMVKRNLTDFTDGVTTGISRNVNSSKRRIQNVIDDRRGESL
ncbi:P107, putative [Pediculus humanus corporis]|uniref:p107, Putative n=1 Tax=Pediculus humanus subsp. corporis TaxID=121224 RepID=E0VGB1_PEDHC|nr:P107, putative [Pediculus humanus corporis]EEB12417.1 P107, putative [Pediculus humanus corporis]